MRAWRIAAPRYALDKLCIGAAMYGGRWNPVGAPAMYCGGSVAIASLEKFVHLGTAPWPELVLVAVDIPDSGPIHTPSFAELPDGWDAMPASGTAQAFGGRWLAGGATLAMQVPSVIIPEEPNFVLNPHHPGYADVTLTVLRTFTHDDRMQKRTP